MNESWRAQPASSDVPEITGRMLADVLQSSKNEEEKRLFKDRWLRQQIDKRMHAKNMEERLKTHLDTACALRDAFLINDARDMFEDIIDTAKDFDEPEYAEKAEEALRNLETLH
ncbi:MAG: hypothetical protein KGI41_00800 [Patescibacteria group bacterium]|nr:hypothetical protein [Patescibacteria group bacterium]MDE1965767.1 hypothetical protein [Patescibacteria group bacterium]